MAAWTAYDVVGKKEDISDVISNISPTSTPFISGIGSESIHNTLFQWQEDSLAAVNTSNAAVQGADATETAPVATTMRQNYTQILTKTLKVADTTDAVDRYGRAKETAYQLGKFAAEVKRDLEAIATSTQVAAVGSMPSTAATFAAFNAQVAAANLVKTGDTEAVVGTATTGAVMSETDFLNALQKLYTAGVEPKMCMIPPGESINIASFASATGRYRTIETGGVDKKIVNAVNLYVSPFGEVKIALNRFMPAYDHHIFDPAMWKLCVLRPWTRETLAKVGDATKMMIKGEFSLKHKNQLASAIVRKYIA